jgi:hydrogen cyanide synthase HcnC
MMTSYDVLIAGGGVIGAACAYHLSRRPGVTVAVIDQKRPGNASRASAGGLWAIGESVGLGCGVIFFRSQQTSGVHADPHMLPRSFFDFALASNDLYPQLHEELLQVHGLDFKFERTGLKFVMYDETDRAYAEAIARNVPHLAQQMRWLDARELREAEPFLTPDTLGALEFLCDHQVSPFRLTDAYLEGARRNGAALYRDTAVTGVLHRGHRVIGVMTDTQGQLGCGTLVNAAGSWAAELAHWATGISLPVRPIKGQIVLSERLPKLLNGCITTSDCYFLQKDNGEVLIGSTTEDVGFDVSTSSAAVGDLARGAMRCFPALEQTQIKRCWAGLRPGTPDELPILGRMAGVDGYLNACGHFRTGILTSAITGVAIDRLVRGEELPLDITPFSADRFHHIALPLAA